MESNYQMNHITLQQNQGKINPWCSGFKLDFDGAILRVTSRFYPLKSHYGKTWDGTIIVCIFDKEVHEEKCDCETLEQLKTKVEKYTEGLRSKIEGLF
mgnify:FL=1